MSPDHPGQPDPARPGRARLRRSGRQLLRIGGLLAAISLVVTLIGGFSTRALVDNVSTNSAALVDGAATVSLSSGDERTLYVTGGLVAPGETVPTPVEMISCTITGPGGPVPFADLASQGERVGIDTAVARFQVVGRFTAQDSGEHQIACEGLGVVVGPEVSPMSVIWRLGALALGTLGSFAGLSMMLIGAILTFFVRRAGDGAAEEEVLDDAVPPEEGADEWWEEESADPQPDARRDPDVDPEGQYVDPDDEPDDEYVELTQEDLDAMSAEEIDTLVRSGALVFEDDVETDETADGGVDPTRRQTDEGRPG